MTENLEEKKNFIKENIIDKGFKEDELLTYINKQKGENSTDFEKWTLDEIKKVYN